MNQKLGGKKDNKLDTFSENISELIIQMDIFAKSFEIMWFHSLKIENTMNNEA